MRCERCGAVMFVDKYEGDLYCPMCGYRVYTAESREMSALGSNLLASVTIRGQHTASKKIGSEDHRHYEGK